jgi:hypothetical protein
MAGLILEIFLYISAVKIFASLDLEQNISFLDGHKPKGDFSIVRKRVTA